LLVGAAKLFVLLELPEKGSAAVFRSQAQRTLTLRWPNDLTFPVYALFGPLLVTQTAALKLLAVLFPFLRCSEDTGLIGLADHRKYKTPR
jgi:hypothetical protein